MTELPTVLHHYTCDHGLKGIVADRKLVPCPVPWLGHALVWLTDLDVPDRAALGLTSEHLDCDRTANRVTVQFQPHMQRWVDWVRQARVPLMVRDMIEGGGALPMHWWVSPVEVPVRNYDAARGHIGTVFA